MNTKQIETKTIKNGHFGNKLYKYINSDIDLYSIQPELQAP